MTTKNLYLDNYIQFLLENITKLLGQNSQYTDSIFSSYEVVPTAKEDNEIELSINTASGLINLIMKDTILYECFIFPNSLCVGNMLTRSCDNLFLKVSDSFWLNKEATVRIRRRKVYGLCYYFSFEFIKQ